MRLYGLLIKVQESARASGPSGRHLNFYVVEVQATSQSRCLGDGLLGGPQSQEGRPPVGLAVLVQPCLLAMG